jgi:hypothetical protein
MNKNSIAVLHNFFTITVQKENQARILADQQIEEAITLMKKRIIVMEKEVEKQRRLMYEKHEKQQPKSKPKAAQEKVEYTSEPVAQVSYFDIIAQKRKKQMMEQNNESHDKSICIDFQSFGDDENEAQTRNDLEHQAGAREGTLKKKRKRKNIWQQVNQDRLRPVSKIIISFSLYDYFSYCGNYGNLGNYDKIW